uniref:KIAA0825 n=1 Tax=Saimiri boliviensis boliviensis TaxID=39432 RepID=A0A2K6UIJ9_SAIBB
MNWDDEYSHSSFDLHCLLNSFPGDLEFEQIFSDIDEKIEQNAASIEHCIKEIQSKINKQCPGVQLQTPTDCFEWLTHYSYSTSKSSFIPHGDLTKFLKTLENLLKNEQNQEEMMLDLLWDLSCHSSVSFPSTLSGTSFHFLSRTSLHSVEDNSSMDVKSIWDDIRLHLRRFLVSKLQSHNEISNSQQKILLKKQCLQQLLFLYPESEVIIKYRNIQKKLLANLLQNCVPSYNRDSNLDIIVNGYQSTMLKLYSVIKEDFNTLCEILAPSSTVKFIKETYLDTVTEEMAKFLENFCELQYRENAVRVVKTSKSSSKHRRAVHALVTPECPQKGRKFSLPLDKVEFLSELIKSFLKLEKGVQELFEELLLSLKITRKHSGILEKSNREVVIEKPRANKTNISSEELLPGKEAILLDFDWRSTFKEVSLPMAHCIITAIESFSEKILQQEQNERSSAVSYTMNLVNVRQVWQDSHMFPEEEQPKKIGKFCSDIMEKLDTMLPLALACRDDSFQEIRANLMEACCKVATAVLQRLQERAKEVPSKAPLKNLHTLLSTAVYVFQYFKQYDNLMKEITKKPIFLVPVQRYQEFINALQFQVTNYCVRVCATSILQDAESHHWDDYKAFYEGERCSFSIQMWHYFCWALHHDLWTILPPKLAQEILAEVLEKSLGLLASRYARAHPSHKRTPQLRLDVTTILICTENMLWSVCTSVRKLLNPHEHTDNTIFKIHTHCNNLFTTLVILTSPLTELYKTFQHGLDESASDSLKSFFKQPLYWVSCISHFYPSLLRTPSAGRLKAEGQLKLLLSQPGCNWNLLLETLLHHDGLLLRILLKSSKQVSDTENNLNQESSLVEAIFKVLYHCSFSPQTFGNVFVSYMEEEQLWDFLYNIPVSMCTEYELEVIRCLRLALTDAVKDIVQQIVSVMSSRRNCETNLNKHSVPDCLLESMPKEWNYSPKETTRKESSKSFTRLAAQAVSIVISKLPTVIACLSPPIKYFFFLSERKMSKNFVELKKAGLLVWNLIVIICRIFEDGNTVELLTGASLDRWSKEKLGLICMCLESIMGDQTSIPNQMIQKVIQSIEQQKPNWIECQLLKARKLSTECAFMTMEKSEASQEGDIALELTEQKINTMVLDLCHKPGGSEYLRQIYHIMQLNEEYLKEQLFSMNSSEEKPLPIRPLKTTLWSMEDQPSAFNPFHVYKAFSENMLDQSAITKWNWNWTNLLPNYLGLDKMTFSVLLKNRWEMKKEETLEEEEKAMLEHLKQICTIQSSSASDNTEEQ